MTDGAWKARARSEWPTVGLIAVTYAVVMALVWFHASLPWWVILPIRRLFRGTPHVAATRGAAWPSDRQPAAQRGAWCFRHRHLWLPYLRYRQTHLTHHNDANLTDPRLDPESYYLLPEHWAQVTGIRRSLYEFNHTLAGRMLIGPAVSIVRFWSSEFRDISNGNRETLRAWVLVRCVRGASPCGL